MAKLEIRFNSEEINNLNTSIVVENRKFLGTGSGMRKFKEQFTEEERKRFPDFYKRFHNWYLIHGVPKTGHVMSKADWVLCQKYVTFFATNGDTNAPIRPVTITKDCTLKTSVTIKEYIVENYRNCGKLVVPVGSKVSNHTACGNDDDYRFWTDFAERRVYNDGQSLFSGYKDTCIGHDLTHYGLNIPAEYCEPYEGEECLLKEYEESQEYLRRNDHKNSDENCGGDNE